MNKEDVTQDVRNLRRQKASKLSRMSSIYGFGETFKSDSQREQANYVKMQRNCQISKATLSKYPKKSVWVDVWHLGDDNPEFFEVSICQSKKLYKNYWHHHVKTLAFTYERSLRSLTDFCKELMRVLGFTPEDFQLLGSTLGDSKWFQEKIKEVSE